MKNGRAILSLLLAFLLCFAPLSLAAAENADIDYASLYYYPAKDISASIYIASEWESLAAETGKAFPVAISALNGDGSVKTAAALFYYLADPTVTNGAADYETARDIALSTGIGIAGLVRYPIGGAPEDAGLIGYNYRVFGEFGSYAVAVAWADESAYAHLDEETKRALDAMVASLRDTDDYIKISEGIEGTLRDFHAADFDGNEVSHLLIGEAKITLVNIWATYCGPCLQEMPDLGALAAEYADQGFSIIGVPIDIYSANGSVDENQLALAKQIVAKTGANYTHLIASGEMLNELQAQAQYVPTSWFFDSEGTLLGKKIIGGMNKADWAALIEEYLTMVA